MSNILRTFGLMLALTGLFVLMGLAVGAYFGDTYGGMAFFLIIAAAMNLFAYFLSDKLVLWSYKAKIVGPAEAPRLHAIVDRLVAKSGIPKPRVAIMPSETPNAFATGRNPKNAVVAATAGILRLLTDEELEAVMAHELGHVRNRDILVMSIAATIAGAIGFASRSIFWGSMFGGGDRDRGGNLAFALLVGILASIAAVLVQLAISRSREFGADESGARLSGRPNGLAAALEKLDSYNHRIPMENANPGSAHLFIVNPLSGGSVARLFSTHPPTKARVARLKKLALEMGTFN
ncbi:MAG: zinc metalloprotease HtpX [Euryarchaeota archaeon]|nr:zinc metalloprotease HtpX [Euryarchaeota archaeon]